MTLRRSLAIFGKILVAFSALWLAWEHFNLETFMRLRGHPWLLILLLVAWVTNQCLTAIRLGVLLRAVGCVIRTVKLIQASFVSLLFTSLLPGLVASDIAKVVLLRRATRGERLRMLGTGVLLDRAIGMATLVFLSVVASLFLFPLPENKIVHGLILLTQGLGIAMALAWLGAFAAAHIIDRKVLSANEEPQPRKLLARAVVFLRSWFVPLPTQGRIVVSSVVAIAAVVIVQVLLCAALFEQMGVRAAFAETAFLFPIVTILSALPITPLGLGVGQVTIGEGFTAFGLPADVGVTIVTLTQLSQAVIALILGGGAYFRSKVSEDVPVCEDECRVLRTQNI